MEDEKSKECWRKIINTFGDKEIELSTKPINKNSNPPCWFTVYADAGDDKKIRVDKPKINIHYSKISKERKLYYSDFKKIYEIYSKNEDEKEGRKQASKVSRNTSYWYGIMDYCGL